MAELVYSAGLTSKLFWLQESRKAAWEENIYQVKAEYYSSDKEGLVYTGGEWDECAYSTFVPDRDNIIPICDEEYFLDDIVSRFYEWVKIVYGVKSLETNLDFIAKALGNKGNTSREVIRNYFLNDFFKDYCNTYSVTESGKCPIYWLFDSGKQNGFKALIYMHCYDADMWAELEHIIFIKRRNMWRLQCRVLSIPLIMRHPLQKN